jgi:predicted metal-dependent TIM-barrel fold hydrolase
MATGVTVLPEHLQNEGVDAVVERLAAARWTVPSEASANSSSALPPA